MRLTRLMTVYEAIGITSMSLVLDELKVLVNLIVSLLFAAAFGSAHSLLE
jgi:hypothetical protein